MGIGMETGEIRSRCEDCTHKNVCTNPDNSWCTNNCKMITGEFKSNCFLQALKAKIRNPRKIKIVMTNPKYHDCLLPHFLWTDGEYEYDFSFFDLDNQPILCFDGHIRARRYNWTRDYENAIKTKRKKYKQIRRRE